MVPCSRAMVSYLAGMTLEALPPQALTLPGHFGCALGALATDTGAAAVRYARMQPAGPCAVTGLGSRTGPETAALANGLLSHTLIFDDMHRQAKLRPGVAVIPAALAAAEASGADGRTLRERVDYCRGEPENPATEAQVLPFVA